MSEAQTREARHTGGCQCGGVRFASYAEPVKIGVCHCRMCQRATSSPFSVLAEIPRTDFEWTTGAPATFQSSSRAERDFCRDCGSPLSFRFVDGDIIELLVCAFDNPNALPPTYVVGAESKVHWLETLESLPSKTTLENAGVDAVAALRSYQSKIE